MKRLSAILASSALLFLISCGSGPAKEDTKAADTTAAVVAPPAEVKPVFTPFKVLTVQHKVKNFDKWETVYNGSDSMSKAYGLSHYMIGRDLKDSNMVYVIEKMEDMAKAKTFSTLPGLKGAMKQAGVLGQPGFTYAEIIRSDDSPVETSDRMMVAHHVKDFGAWVKVFDAEGADTRKANGMIDRQLARSLADSNMVYITFAVSDMGKAKARAMSPELKKTMTDAGVDSPPTIRWFKVVN
jgi:quinol monooxygenase YgiN